MPNRFIKTIVLTIFGVSTTLAACSDDSDDTGSGSGGSGGASGGNGGTSGASAGGSSSGTAGSSGGTAGSSAGTTGSGGKGGSAGSAAQGGSAGSDTGGTGGTGAEGGDGTGGEGGQMLTYACNDVSINHKACSALAAANCPESIDCADCVMARASEGEPFASCPACAAQYEAYLQCAVDAFESGNLAEGVECVPDYGADFTLPCYAFVDEAIACSDYEAQNECPSSWPL